MSYNLFFCKTIYIINIFFMILIFNASAFARQNKFQIKGIVLDLKTNQPLKDANVELLKSKIGTSTNKKGEFYFYAMPLEMDTLCISFMGYKTVKLPIEVKKSLSNIEIKLDPKVLVMPELSVLGDRLTKESRPFLLDPSAQRIHSQDIKKMPSVGSPDVFRMLQSIPGVTFTNEASSHLNVRGGNFDQNLVMLDGAVIYYPFHIFGLASVFNVNFIDDIYFSLGGFSARYGDRLSSVLSLQSRKPQKNFPNRVNVSIIGADVTTGGKLGQSFGWVFSGRTSYFKLPNKLTYFDFPYDYYDGTLKIDYSPFKNHHLQIMGIKTSDYLKIDGKWKGELLSSIDQDKLDYTLIDRDKLRWINTVLSARWEGELAENLSYSFQVYKSIYGNSAQKMKLLTFPGHVDDKFLEAKKQVETDISQANDSSRSTVRNQFRDLTSKASFEWILSPRINFRTGFQWSNFYTDYGWNGSYHFMEKEYLLFFDHASSDSFKYNRRFSSNSFFAEGEFVLSSHLRARTGLRLTHWDASERIYPEPRLNLKYSFNKDGSFVLSYGRFTQGLATALENGLVGFLELYFPVNIQHNIETSDHFISSIHYKLFSRAEISLGAYYKEFSGLLKSIGTEPSFAQTPGKAYGFEIELKSKLLGFDGRISYAWAHSNRKFNNIVYDTNFDQRHRMQVSANRALGKDFNVSIFWELHTGQPYTPRKYRALILRYRVIPPANGDWNDEWYNEYEVNVPRGRIRYPIYHRLDLSIMKVIRKKEFTFAPYLSIRNVYNRQNPLFYKKIEFKMDSKDGKFLNPRIDRDAFVIGILPTFGVRFGF